jgi:hypothetical protein
MMDKETLLILIIGVQFGYRECEKGSNIQQALERAKKLFTEDEIEISGE